MTPAISVLPTVSGFQTIISNRANLVRHGESQIIFVVERAGNDGNRAARDHFADEHDSPADFVGGLPSHVEAQVHFFEIRVQWDRHHPKHFCIQKLKSDEADKYFSVPRSEEHTSELQSLRHLV